MGCKPADVCEGQKSLNFVGGRPSNNQCRPNIKNQHSPSLCRQCCYTINCTGTDQELVQAFVNFFFWDSSFRTWEVKLLEATDNCRVEGRYDWSNSRDDTTSHNNYCNHNYWRKFDWNFKFEVDFIVAQGLYNPGKVFESVTIGYYSFHYASKCLSNKRNNLYSVDHNRFHYKRYNDYCNYIR